MTRLLHSASFHLRLLAMAGGLLAFGTAPSAQAQTAAYNIVDLGALSGTVSSAYAINNAGQIVGFSGSGATGDPQHAALWTMQSDGSIVGKDLGAAGDGTSSATGVNDAGLISGWAAIPVGYHATTYRAASDGTVARTNLGTFGAQDFGEAFGYGINASGQVAGNSYVKSGTPYHAFLFALSGTTPVDTDLGTLGGDDSTAYAINDAGQIVGNSQAVPSTVAGNHPFYATLWTPNGDGTFAALNLGPNSGSYASAAYGINNAGQIVGGFGTGTAASQQAALWTVSGSTVTLKALGTLGSGGCNAYAINDAGQVVGGYKYSSTVNHGFLYTSAAAGLVDLNNLVGSGPVATNLTPPANSAGRCINKFGQIVGYGTVGGKQHAVLLNPANPPVSTSGSTQETALLAGKVYSVVPIFTNPASNSRNTQFGFLDGVAGSGGSGGSYGTNRDVTVDFTANPATTPLSSDAVHLSGTAGDVVTIQMSYAPGYADAYYQYDTNGCLGWYNGAHWVNAVDGNTGGTVVFAGNRAYSAATDFHLGTWGLDTAHGVAWAVVNHGGTFGVTINPDVLRRVQSTGRSGTVTTLVLNGFTGHVYQLQRASALTGAATDFADVESAQSGNTGNPLYFSHDDGPDQQGFYRIRLDP